MSYKEYLEEKYGKMDKDQYEIMSHHPYDINMFNDKYLSVLYVNTDKKPSREEILEQLWRDMRNPNLIFDDELAFLNHLLRKWSKE